MRTVMDEERFISGIYNYCDYWCERCAFTKRCRNFVMGREMEREARGEAPVDDATQRAFWNQLADQLREAARLLRCCSAVPAKKKHALASKIGMPGSQ